MPLRTFSRATWSSVVKMSEIGNNRKQNFGLILKRRELPIYFRRHCGKDTALLWALTSKILQKSESVALAWFQVCSSTLNILTPFSKSNLKVFRSLPSYSFTSSPGRAAPVCPTRSPLTTIWEAVAASACLSASNRLNLLNNQDLWALRNLRLGYFPLSLFRLSSSQSFPGVFYLKYATFFWGGGYVSLSHLEKSFLKKYSK